MPEVIITNMQSKVDVSPKLETLVEDIIKYTLGAENVSKNAEVSVAMLDDQYIQKLNKTYRSTDAPTDVLSFAMRDNIAEEQEIVDNEGMFEGEGIYKDGEELLGDIVISLERAAIQAREYGHSLEREVAYLAVHGTLHLLGYDHETPEDKSVMRQKEEEMLKKHDLIRGY